MVFWIFMLIVNLLIPVIMIGFGNHFSENAPGKINSLFGYRTTMSMKNENTWAFAHTHFAMLWLRWGRIMLPLSFVLMLFSFNRSQDFIGNYGLIILFIQLIFLISTIPLTEKALKKYFDKDGNSIKEI